MTETAPHDNALMHAWQRRQPGADPVWRLLTERLEERLHDSTTPYPHVYRLNDVAAGLHGFALPAGNITDFKPPYDAVLCPLWPTVAPDVSTLLHVLKGALRPGGLLLASALGPGSFAEFRHAWAQAGEHIDGETGWETHATGHVMPFADGPAWAGLLHTLKLDSPVVDIDRLTLTFSDLPTLYASLRAHGAANFHPARTPGLTGKTLFKRMEEAYRGLFARPDGRLPLTLEIMYLHGLKPAGVKVRVV